MGYTRRSSASQKVHWEGRHRFEHWYRDNQVCFITARCRGRFPAFECIDAKDIFWRQFDKHTVACGFTPFVTSLISNHYHTIGYLKRGDQLGRMMRLFHGSVAKLVNDTLSTRRTVLD